MSIAPLTDAIALPDAAPFTDAAALLLLARDASPATVSDEEIRAHVALHVAATLLSASATVTAREQVRANWYAALKPVTGIHDDWALAYVPGVHYGDNETYAMHLSTGCVFGGVGNPTGQQRGESTDMWLSRLADLLIHA